MLRPLRGSAFILVLMALLVAPVAGLAVAPACAEGTCPVAAHSEVACHAALPGTAAPVSAAALASRGVSSLPSGAARTRTAADALRVSLRSPLRI